MSITKERIIEVAKARFSRYGFIKTTMNEIADDLNITKGNLYYYYADKCKLISDVIICITYEILEGQSRIINNYKSNFLESMYEMLEDRCRIIKRYYLLHLSENNEWIKELEKDVRIKTIKSLYIESLKNFFITAENKGELKFVDVEESATLYIEIMKGIALAQNITDVINCIPDSDKMDEILERQKLATKFIFQNKIVD